MNEEKFLTIVSSDGSVRIAYSGEPTLLELLRSVGAAMSAPCGGDGRCGGCAVRISGQIAPPNAAERELLGDRISDGIRLACRVRLLGQCEIDSSDNSISYTNKLHNAPTDSAGESNNANSSAQGYALAVDIGTTTVALRLLSADGAVLCERSELNAQRSYGADVMTRISRCAHGLLEPQRDAICDQLADMTADALRCAGGQISDVTECAVVGNPTMLHILSGIDPSPLGQYPYDTGERFGAQLNLCRSGLPKRAYLALCIGGFTGGDLIAVLAAIGNVSEGTCICDLGTNAELAVRTADGWLVCSTAAGPALEGGGISCGTGGIAGAVGRITEDAATGELRLYQLGGSEKLSGEFSAQAEFDALCGAPSGLTGAALLDLTAILLRRNIIDRTGRMECLSLKITDRLALTQADIRQLQLAKGAIAAALMRLSREARIDRIIITGGLGCRIDPRSAVETGLIPQTLAVSDIRCVPALALDGAQLFCTDEGKRRAADISAHCTELNLTGDPLYDELFIECMEF